MKGMKSPRFFLATLLVLVLVLTVFFYRGALFQILNNFRSRDYEKLRELVLENEGLKAELQTLKEKIRQADNSSLIPARIYSSYPWNDRRLLVVDLGESNGILTGMPVLVKAGVLLGKVKEVRRKESVVQTIFDPAWRSSVIITTYSTPRERGEVKALLQGGAVPTLTLIAKEAVIAPGDKVFNTSPEFPLGLFVGRVAEIEASPTDVFKKAQLSTLYEPEELDEVLVLTNFP